jgi:transketolase
MPSRKELANAIRALSMDAVQKANSGHPGAPMGMADIATTLFLDFLKHNPSNPAWPNRDRFILSNGHGSMLLYSLLHLSGYELSIEDIKNFRQLHSKTAGHPEFGLCPGVETTTGPLGQGVANAVGMALAEKLLAARFNRDGHTVVDHYTYTLLGDGCLMEGVSHEACSFAGTLGLGKLIALWDDNGISIDGHVTGWWADDTPARFEAYGWHVVRGVDGHDGDAVKRALEEARGVTDKPSLICCKTVIGFGAPNLGGSHNCHGAPLGEKEIAAARAFLNWTHEPFVIPADIYKDWDAKDKGAAAEAEWLERMQAYADAYPELADEFVRRIQGGLPTGFDELAEEYVQALCAKPENLATRKASQKAINAYAPLFPEFLGGSADLTGSNLTNWSGYTTITHDNFNADYLSYGVREFGMAAIMNGLALHGGFLPFGGTFLVFSDYMRNGMRMAALMGLRVLYVLTHDSIGVGEDGPTHQPIEHTPSLRLIPNLAVWRPCDAVETAIAWKSAIAHTSGPSALILSRQNLKAQPRDEATLANIGRGGYVLRDCNGAPDVVLLATGSEVGATMDAAALLEAKGRRARVVSMPCTEVFDAQPEAYRKSVLPDGPAYIAVEAGATDGWWKYIGRCGVALGIDRFGESAPGGKLFEFFGFTPENIAKTAESALARKSAR